MVENLLARISQRWLEAVQEELGRWVEQMTRETFNPAAMMSFIRSLGLDASQLSGLVGQRGGFDPYRVLGLDRSAADEEVKRRYRELIHRLHPDKSGTQATGFLFQVVKAAYEAIKMERGWHGADG